MFLVIGFEKLLKNIKSGSPYPDLRQAQMIDDEILLYLNPKRIFSLRMFLYGPGDYTPIHDHNSWGISGASLGVLGVIRCARDDAGKLVALDVKAGDIVLFGKWSGTEVKIDGEDLLIMKESDIMGVIEGAKKSKKAA